MNLTNIAEKMDMSISELLSRTENAESRVSTPIGDIQRPYVWTDEMNNSLIQAINDRRLEKSFVIVDYGGEEKPTLVIDGKQRLNAINNHLNSLTDLSEKQSFRKKSVLVYVIKGYQLKTPLTLAQIAQIFLSVNATGVPQSLDHIELVKQIANSNL